MMMQIQWIQIEDLKEHPKNPNTHDAEQIKRLAELIKYQGWRHPIIVSNQTGLIVAGHGRLAAARLLEQEKVPVHFQDFFNEDQEYAFLVSDNAIASWSKLEFEQINLEIANLSPSFDINMMGISNFKIDPSEKEKLTKSCPHCGKEIQ